MADLFDRLCEECEHDPRGIIKRRECRTCCNVAIREERAKALEAYAEELVEYIDAYGNEPMPRTNVVRSVRKYAAWIREGKA